MISQPQVFNSEENLEEPFVPVKRVNIKETGLGASLRQLIFDYCIKKGKPLVLTGFEQLNKWDANLFDIGYLQEIKENKIQVYEQYNDSSPVTVTWKDYVNRLQEDSILTSKNMNLNNNTDKNTNNDNVNYCLTQNNDGTNNIDTKDESTVQIEQVEQIQEKENVPALQNIAEKVKLNTRKVQYNKYSSNNNYDDNKNNNNQHHYEKRKKSCLHKKKLYYGKDLDCPKSYLDKVNQLVPNYLLPLGNDDLMASLPKHLQAINLLCYLGGSGTGTPFHCDISGSLGHNLMTYADQDAFSHWLIIDKSDTEKLRHAVKENDIPLKSWFDQNSCPEIIYNDKVSKNKRDHDDIDQNEEDETTEEPKTKRHHTDMKEKKEVPITNIHHVDTEVPNTEKHNGGLELMQKESNTEGHYEDVEVKDKAHHKERHNKDDEKNKNELDAKRYHGDIKEIDVFISSTTATTNINNITDNKTSSMFIYENESFSIIPSTITIVTNKEFNNEKSALPIQEEASFSVSPAISPSTFSLTSSLSISDSSNDSPNDSSNDSIIIINDNDDELTIKQQKVTTFNSSEDSSTEMDDVKMDDNITVNQEKYHFKNPKSKPSNVSDIKQEESISDIDRKKMTLFLDSERAIVTINQLKENNIKTHVVTQKPGDLVIIPSVCYHQVTNIGISFKVAWNRITAHSLHEGITKQLPFYKKIGRPETYRCSATIYFTLKEFVYNNLTVTKEDQDYFKQSYQIIIDMFYKDVLSHEIIETIENEEVNENGIINDFKEESPKTEEFDMICDFCSANIFHRYYQCDECQIDLCLNCYAHGRTCKHPPSLSMHQTSSTAFNHYCQLYFNSLKKMNDIFSSVVVQSNVTTFKTNNQTIYPLATICRRLEVHRKKNDLLCNHFYCFHCDKHFSLIELQHKYKTNIFSMLKRRCCTSKPTKFQKQNQIDRIFSCMDCSKMCSGCQPLNAFNKENSGEVFYFNDLTRGCDWYGGSYDNLLFQSACWPNYGVMMNDDRKRLNDICKQKKWSYPEDFFNLAAATFTHKIYPAGWTAWASKKNHTKMVDLIRKKAQKWTDYEKQKFKNSSTIPFDSKFQFYEPKNDRDDFEEPLIKSMYFQLTASEFPIIRKSLETRGRKRLFV